MDKYEIVTQHDSIKLYKNGILISSKEPSEMTLNSTLGQIGEALAFWQIYDEIPEDTEIILTRVEA